MRYTENAKLPLRDGTQLNYDLYQPDRESAYPTILMRTPYTKTSLLDERIYANVRRYTDHGYIVMVSECRGTGASEGVLNANAAAEYDDGVDTIAWIAAQPWCDGNVGMFGLSYFGFTQLAAASERPKALKAICPFMTQAMEPFGSQMTQTYNYGHICWIYGQLLSHPERFIPNESERKRLLPILKEHADKLTDYAIRLPADKNPAALVEGVPLVKDYLDLIRGMEDKSFWDSLRHPTDFSRTHTAMFHCTGWFDVCLNTTIHNWNAVMTQCDSFTRDAARLLIGPWAHGGEFHSAYGDYDFGAENDGAGQDINGQMLQWFDRHIKGKSDVADWPKVRYFVLGSNRWLSSSAWPPVEAVQTPYYLHEGGRLDVEAPIGAETPDTYTYDPMNPAPAYASRKEGTYDPLPNYAPLGCRDDTITFETSALTSPMTLAGTVTMKLYAVTDVKDTDFTCRIVDVAPDGREFILTQGLIRAKWRHGFFQLDPIIPDEPTEYTIEVGNAGFCFLPGHRVKLHISSALFPLYDRNLNTGEPSATCDHYAIAHQTLLHDQEHPSCILLPLLPNETIAAQC